MLKRTLAVCFLAGFLVCPLSTLLAQQLSLSIRVLSTFDYPGTGNSTTPNHISSSGDCTGTYVDLNGATRGFIRLVNGTFSAPIVDPNDDSNFTYAGGIDSSRTVSGYYFNSAEGHYHGFFFTNGTYIPYDVINATDTFLLDCKECSAAGEFSGYFLIGPDFQAPFAQVNGLFYQFGFSPAGPIQANGLNGTGQVVGEYVDYFSPPTFHGFYYDIPRSVIARPFDFPGSTSTRFTAINDQGIVVGSYLDSGGGEHGLIFTLPDKYVSYDFPGASGTSLNGINNSGLVSGRQTDFAGVNHGFIGKIGSRP